MSGIFNLREDLINIYDHSGMACGLVIECETRCSECTVDRILWRIADYFADVNYNIQGSNRVIARALLLKIPGTVPGNPQPSPTSLIPDILKEGL